MSTTTNRTDGQTLPARESIFGDLTFTPVQVERDRRAYTLSGDGVAPAMSPCIPPIVRRLNELLAGEYARGQEGYALLPFEVFRTALAAMCALCGNRVLPAPMISINPVDELVIEWHMDGVDLELSFSEAGSPTALVVTPEGGVVTDGDIHGNERFVLEAMDALSGVRA